MAPWPGASHAAADTSSSEELPFRPRKREDEALAHAVARGQTALWPATIVSTLAIGVGCSVGGIVKTKGWSELAVLSLPCHVLN